MFKKNIPLIFLLLFASVVNADQIINSFNGSATDNFTFSNDYTRYIDFQPSGLCAYLSCSFNFTYANITLKSNSSIENIDTTNVELYLKLDDNKTNDEIATDETGNNIPEVVSTPDVTNTGVIRGAYSLMSARGDCINLTYVWNDDADNSVNLWVKTANTDIPASSSYVWGTTRGGDFEFYLQYTGATAKYTAGIRAAAATASTTVESTNAMNDGNWHMLTVVWYDGGQRLEIWIDGIIQDVSSMIGANSWATTDQTSVGASNNNGAVCSSGPFNGSIDEFSWFHYRLTATEILRLNNSGYGYPYPFYEGLNITINQSGQNIMANKTGYLSVLNTSFYNHYYDVNCTGSSCFLPVHFQSGENVQINYTAFNLVVDETLDPQNVIIYDEETGLEFDMNKINVTVSVYCPSETLIFNISNSNQSIEIDCVYNYLRADFQQGADTYFRTIIPEYTELDKRFYAADLNDFTVVRVTLALDDLTGDFGSGSKARLEKTLQSGEIIVIEQLFNSQSQVILYMIQDDPYSLTIISPTGVQRNIGEIVANIAETITITIPSIIWYPETQILHNTLKWYYTPTPYNHSIGYIRLQFLDNLSQSNSVNWTITNDTGHIVHTFVTTSNSFTSSFNTPLENLTYTGVLWINHSELGILEETRIFSDYGGIVQDDLLSFGDSGEKYLKWGAGIFLLLLAMVATVANAYIILVLVGIFLFFFVRIGWIPIDPYTVTIVIIIIGLNWFKSSKNTQGVNN